MQKNYHQSTSSEGSQLISVGGMLYLMIDSDSTWSCVMGESQCGTNIKTEGYLLACKKIALRIDKDSCYEVVLDIMVLCIWWMSRETLISINVWTPVKAFSKMLFPISLNYKFVTAAIQTNNIVKLVQPIYKVIYIKMYRLDKVQMLF